MVEDEIINEMGSVMKPNTVASYLIEAFLLPVMTIYAYALHKMHGKVPLSTSCKQHKHLAFKYSYNYCYIMQMLLMEWI